MTQPATTRYDVVVVGSGFGGSIAALRLAEAGKSVCVLERGRRYRPGEFPRDVTNVDELLWDHPRLADSLGLFDLRFLSGIGVVTASGVGGGSLIYAGIHIRPDPDVFDDPRWPKSVDRAALEPYYDRVARMLDARPLPAEPELPKRNMFRSAAAELGRDVFDPDQAVAWTGSPGPGRSACRLVAECEFGCQHGAKNTMDHRQPVKPSRRDAHGEPGELIFLTQDRVAVAESQLPKERPVELR